MLCSSANSQNKFSGIQGQFVLPNKALNDTITVLLIHLPDSAIVNTTITKGKGLFRFNNVLPGTYAVSIHHPCYQKYASQSIVVSGSGLVSMGTITLHPDIINLKEVTITNPRAYIETRYDKTVLNVEKGIMAEGVSVLDVLGTAPGVRINSAGDVLLRGGQKASIAINGRILNLASADAAEQLKNMPSGSVNQIELITNPSAKYDATGAGGIVNIILKKGQDEGFNGSVTMGAGYGDFYKLTPSLALNYRTKKLNFFGNYAFNDNHTDHTINIDRYVGSTARYDEHYYNQQKIYSSTYNFGADYSIDDKHTLGFLVVGSFSNNFIDKNTVTTIGTSTAADSSLTTLAVLNRRINTINYNLNYSGILGKSNQTISADADYFLYNRNSFEDLNSTMYNVHTNITGNPMFYRNEAPTHIMNISGRVDYINPISQGRRLEAGLKTIIATNDNIQRFDNVVNDVHTPNPLISSQFNYNDNISSAYINYIATPSAKFNYLLGMRVEHTGSDADNPNYHISVKRSYTDYFPTVVLNYTLNTNHSLTFNYNRRIDRPNYSDLNPLIAYQDRYNITTGNAYLKPSYQDNISITHTYKNKFGAKLYAAFVRDYNNFTYFAQSDISGLFITGKINLKQATTYGIELTAPVTINDKWSAFFDVDANLQHYVDYAGLLNKTTPDAIFKVNQQVQLPADLTFALYADYEVNTFYAMYNYRANYSVMPSFSKRLFNKRATLSFSAKDIFNTDRNRYSTDYANLNMVGYDKRETRIYSLSFTYRFGKSSVKAARKHTTGNNEDLKRVNPGTN
ncbi:outer membrane beta-barrel family protein [Mucilaginibacter boryungensis]